jgi:hypothetical protein
MPCKNYYGSAKIAYEHLLEVPNYYTLLEELEDKGDELFPDTEAKRAWVRHMRQKHADLWASANN